MAGLCAMASFSVVEASVVRARVEDFCSRQVRRESTQSEEHWRLEDIV